MPIYHRVNGVLVDKKTGQPMELPAQFVPQAPMVMKPMPDYQSPIDGRPITSRNARKDDLKRHGCVEYEPSMSPTKGKIKSKKFAAKYGMQVSEEFR